MKNQASVLLGAGLLAAASSAIAASTAVAVGPFAAPTVLGPYSLTPFSDDIGLEFDFVDGVVSPLGGQLRFSQQMQHLEFPLSWASWGHEVVATDVYAFEIPAPGAPPFSLALQLPLGTGAFLFYAHTPDLGIFTITATLEDGTLLSQDVDEANGASGFGFYAALGESLTSVVIESTDEFAIGEFSIGRALSESGVIPEAGNLGLGGLVLAGVGWPVLRRYRRRG